MRIIGFTSLILLFLTAMLWAASDPKTVSENLDTMTVTWPVGTLGKLPVIFLAHNGGATKEDWGDYPAELAGKGFFVVNIGWTSFGGCDDLVASINKALERYPDRIDSTRAAFVGGCHGGVKMDTAMEGALPITLKALVLLSISENNPPPAIHPPVLGIYSLNDHLGSGYVGVQKMIYTKAIKDPKKVIALDATPHGNELVTDPATKVQVRSAVTDWITSLL